MKVKVMADEDCYKHFNRSFKLALNSKCIRKEVDAYFELVSTFFYFQIGWLSSKFLPLPT